MSIRPVLPSDLETVGELIRELAIYERSADMARSTIEQLRSSFFAPEPRVFCDVVDVDGAIVGYAVWFLNYSTWTGTHGIFLEDLFVRPQFRGRGYGRDLLVHLASICVDRGYHRLEWSVLDWNTPAIEFYESLGATAMDEWTVHRLTGESLHRLGRSSAQH